MNHTRPDPVTTAEVARATDMHAEVLLTRQCQWPRSRRRWLVPRQSAARLPEGRSETDRYREGAQWLMGGANGRSETPYDMCRWPRHADRGDAQAQKVAIIAKGLIGIGGGSNLHYANNFSSRLPRSTPAATSKVESKRVTVKAAATASIQSRSMTRCLWTDGVGGAGSHGLFRAAPTFDPEGAIRTSGGLCFAAPHYTPLGGNLKFNACWNRRGSHYDQALPAPTATRQTALLKSNCPGPPCCGPGQLWS